MPIRFLKLFSKSEKKPMVTDASLSPPTDDFFTALATISVSTKSKNNLLIRPAFATLDAVLNHLYELKPSFNLLDESVRQLVILLRDVYLHARNEVAQYESDRAEYDIDIDLHEQKNHFQALDLQAEHAFQAALSAYRLSELKLRNDIDDLDQKIVDVNLKQIISELRDLELYGKLHQEIEEQLESARQAMEDVSCFQRFFCHVPEKVKKAYKQINELERKRKLLEADDVDQLRDGLIKRLQDTRELKRAELESIAGKQPVRNDNYREAYVAVEARIRSDEFEYYSEISQLLMLDFLKMHFIVYKIFKSIPEHADDLSFEHKTINRDAQVAVRDLFDRLKKTLNSSVAGFYCSSPGRYYFSDYLKNMRAIKDNAVINALIVGDATDEQIQLVMPEYDSVGSHGLIIPKFSSRA